MVETLSQSKPVARKRYNCEASYWLRENGIDRGMLTFAELRAVAKAKANNYCIMPGEQHICQNNKMDGVLYSFRAIPAIHAICIRLEIYDID